MANCKYCGQFISHWGEGIESNDVIGFLEIQETEYFHTKCKPLERHYFDAPEDDKSSRFCKCGKYLTDNIHIRYNETIPETPKLSNF